MKKKSLGKVLSSTSVTHKSTAIEEINKKLNSSAALNGGFDTLLYKIDKIEQSQGQLVNKVDKIHDAIYDPTDGIFSKLNEYKLETSENINEVSQTVAELKTWRIIKDREEIKDDELEIKTKNKLDEIEKTVDSLVINKNTVWTIMKWFLAAVGGGIVTLVIKWVENKWH
jgi:hypothetical protein